MSENEAKPRKPEPEQKPETEPSEEPRLSERRLNAKPSRVEVERLRWSNDFWKMNVQDLRSELKQKAKEIEAMAAEIARLERFEKKAKKAKKRVRELKEENAALRKAVNELSARMLSLADEKRGLEEENQNLHDRLTYPDSPVPTHTQAQPSAAQPIEVERLRKENRELRNEVARLNGQTFEVVDRAAIKAEALRDATKPTEERIEAMAKAIHDDENSAFDVDWGPGYFDNELVMTQDMFRRVARAALATLRRFELGDE